MDKLLRVMMRLARIVTFGRLKYSRQVEGNSLYMSLGEKLWWGYKYFGNPILQPQRNRGIREHFEENPPEGFNLVAEDGRQSKDLPSLTIKFAGDMLPCPNLPPTPFGHLLDVISFFETGDICCANLESPVLASVPISPPPVSITTPPDMNNNPEAVDYLLQRAQGPPGVVVFSTANNHSMDMGVEGVVATLDYLDDRGIKHVGSARNPAERDALLVVESCGFNVAFLSWTFSLNSHTLPSGQEYLVNTLRLNIPDVDISPIAAQVEAARKSGAEVIVLLPHWGLEDERFPLASQIETAHRLARCGIDIICGNHPHALQPSERYVWHELEGDAEQLHECLIMYALGDFLNPLPFLGLSALSATMEVTLVKLKSGSVVISQAKTTQYHDDLQEPR